MRHVILPKDNESDLVKLPATVREEMQFTLVGTLADVLDTAFA